MPICFLSKKLIGNLLKPGLSPSTSTFQQHNSGKFWVTTVWRCIPTNSKPVSNAVRDVCDRWMPIFAAIEYFYQQQRLSQNLKYIWDPGQSFRFAKKSPNRRDLAPRGTWHPKNEKWKISTKKCLKNPSTAPSFDSFCFFPNSSYIFVLFPGVGNVNSCER